MLGHPALVARDHRCDPQRVALLAQQRVAAVTRSVRQDLAGLGEVGDVLVRVARPCDICLTGLQGSADRVQTLDEEAVVAEQAQHLGTHAGHDLHRQHDVGGVGQFDAELRVVGAERAHAERDDVHRAAAHAAAEEGREGGAHLVRCDPVVRGARILFTLGADEGARLDARDVGGIGLGQVGIGLVLFVQLEQRARLDEFCGETIPLLVTAVGPHHAVGLSELGDLGHPCQQRFVLCRSGAGFQARNRGGGHISSSEVATRIGRPVWVAYPQDTVTERALGPGATRCGIGHIRTRQRRVAR